MINILIIINILTSNLLDSVIRELRMVEIRRLSTAKINTYSYY
jgi:hypothetical protein